MRSKLRPLASRTEGWISWGKKIQFAFKCHLQTVSFILTTQVIEVGNVKVSTLRNFTQTLSRQGDASPGLGWDTVGDRGCGPRAVPFFMQLLSL